MRLLIDAPQNLTSKERWILYEYIKGQYEGTRDNAVIVEMTGMGYVINV